MSSENVFQELSPPAHSTTVCAVSLGIDRAVTLVRSLFGCTCMRWTWTAWLLVSWSIRSLPSWSPCSESSHVPDASPLAEDYEAYACACAVARREVQIIEKQGLGPDHIMRLKREVAILKVCASASASGSRKSLRF